MNNKAIFLDRDGVLNKDLGYVYKIEDLIILDGVKIAIEKLRNMWYLLIVITNQSGIWRWLYSLEECDNFHKQLQNNLWLEFDDIYICPHTEMDRCKCRKPWIQNILFAQKKYKIDLGNSYFIWDKTSDIQCWKNAWCKTVFLWEEDPVNENPTYTVKSLYDFANIINSINIWI